MSIVHGCPPSAIGPSLLLTVLGTVSLSPQHVTSAVGTLHVCFSRSPRGFPLQAFLPTTFTVISVVPACAVTVIIFGHLNRSFLLHFTYYFYHAMFVMLSAVSHMPANKQPKVFDNCRNALNVALGVCNFHVERFLWQHIVMCTVQSTETRCYSCVLKLTVF